MRGQVNYWGVHGYGRVGRRRVDEIEGEFGLLLAFDKNIVGLIGSNRLQFQDLIIGSDGHSFQLPAAAALAIGNFIHCSLSSKLTDTASGVIGHDHYDFLFILHLVAIKLEKTWFVFAEI